ncbi:uncharacterized protein LOC110445609 isoform X2 [Mizuhopecten yessoensis]|nr:uncharacterized protein LOC110445609 isoform X2 [Mizuhopecten yessoensis]
MKPQGIGKSLKKCGKQKLNKSPPPKGVEIIAAMFKQQSAGVSRGSTSMPSNVGHSSDNSNSNDVTVVKVENPLRLTEQDLQRLASCFGSGWEMFVGQLGVGSEKVDQKKIENPTHVPSQVYNCLLVWFRQCPTQPTITVFDQTVQNSLDFCTVNMDKYETLKREIEKR